jgi:hypothetical protein
MGLDSFVLGFGPFHEDVIDCLDYSEDFYDGTKEGTVVFTTFFQCNTSSQSRELAEELGCEVWDFNTHELDPCKINSKTQRLQELFSAEEVHQFLRCMSKGFRFFFQPNG